MQNYQPDIYLDVLEMQELLKSMDFILKNVEKDFEETIGNGYIQNLNIEGVKRWEKILNIYPKTNVLDERISSLLLIFRGLQKLSEIRIKEIASSFKNGDVEVTFENSTIKIKYNSVTGVPPNFVDFENTLKRLKPAHLQLAFTFLYLWWDKFDSYNKTWDEWDNLNLNWNEWEEYVI